MAGIHTALPVPTQPWKTAKTRFLQGLSPKEVEEFRNATPENLFYKTSAVQKKHVERSKTWLLQERLASFVDGLNDYGKALDLFPNMCPMILAPLWGSVRVVLQIAGEAGKFQEKIVDMIAQIGDVLPRFRIFEKIFSNHERLLAALAEAYLDVLQFCVLVKDFFLKARKSYIPLSIVVQGAWKPFRAAFEQHMLKFRKHQKKVEKEADLAHKIDAARARELERVRGEIVKRDIKVNRRHRIITSLPVVDFQAKHRKLCELRHPGTIAWLWSNSRFQTWLTSPTSDCLPCFGIPGSGKSVLAASVANDTLSSFKDPRSLFLYYYCDYADASSLELRYIIASLIKQVLIHLPLDIFDEEFAVPYAYSLSVPGLNQSMEFLWGMFAHFNAVFVSIDGLDELETRDQESILLLIHTVIKKSKTTVKFLVTSRTEEHQIRRSLANFQCVTLSTDVISSDIELLINERMETKITRSNPLMGNERLKREVVKALVRGAQGMFLWVTFMLYEIEEALTEADVRSVIDNFPKSLFDIYLRIIEKAQDIGGLARIHLMRKAYLWIAYARRPLRLEELEEAVGLDKQDKHLHAERIAANAGERLVKACSNLVVYNRSDDTVTFAHHSVKQFLTSTLSESASPIFESFHLDPRLSELELAGICIAYLSFADFETQLVHAPKSPELPRQDIERVIWGAVPLGNLIWTTVSRGRFFRDKANEPEDPQVAIYVPTTVHPSEALSKKYKLLEYITAFWIYHTAAMDISNDNWSSFHHLVRHKRLMFDFRPWLEARHQSEINDCLQSLYSSAKISKPAPGLYSGRTWFRELARANISIEHSRELCMYTWAIRNNVKSLLSTVHSKPLEYYFDGKYGHVASQFVVELLSTLRSPPFLGSIWSAELILTICKTASFYLSPTHWLSTLEEELETWKGPACPPFNEIMAEAVIRASPRTSLGDERSALITSQIRSPERLAKLIIALCKQGHLGSEIGIHDLCIKEVKGGEITEETMFELAFALDSYLPHLSCSLERDPQYLVGAPLFILRMLLALALCTPDELTLARKVASHWSTLQQTEKSRCWYYVFTLPDLDWTSTALGSANVYKKLETIQGLEILDIAYTQARKCCVETKLKYPRQAYFKAMENSGWSKILGVIGDSYRTNRTSDPWSEEKLKHLRSRGQLLLDWKKGWVIYHPSEDPILKSLYTGSKVDEIVTRRSESTEIRPYMVQGYTPGMF